LSKSSVSFVRFSDFRQKGILDHQSFTEINNDNEIRVFFSKNLHTLNTNLHMVTFGVIAKK
jgi:hypothetical protein